MRAIRRLRSSRGFTLLELTIVICIIAVLGAVLADRLQRYAEFAEKTSMEYTANTINTALLFEFAQHIISGNRKDLPTLMQANPMSWLAQKPTNYLGELHDPPTDPEQGGSWYYDAGDHLLVYLVRRGDNFQADSAGLKRVRYRVKLLYDEAQPTSLIGMILSPVEPYKWF
jgi:general secretion pathway protein G